MTKPWSNIVDCVFVSVWDDGPEVISPASFDSDTGRVFDIQTALLSDTMLEECQHLKCERIIVGGREYAVERHEDGEYYALRTFSVFFSRGGYAQVKATNAPEAMRIADETLTHDDVSWDDDWPATDAQLEDETAISDSWSAYCQYLRDWADSHSDKGFEGCCPVCYDEFLDCEWMQMQEDA